MVLLVPGFTLSLLPHTGQAGLALSPNLAIPHLPSHSVHSHPGDNVHPSAPEMMPAGVYLVTPAGQGVLRLECLLRGQGGPE